MTDDRLTMAREIKPGIPAAKAMRGTVLSAQGECSLTVMRQAIETKYLGPTNTKGARIKASAEAGHVTVPFDYGPGTDNGAHDLAMIALVAKLGWCGVWARGGKADGTGNVYVCISLDRPRGTKP